jgi:hypothetical protein
MGDSQGENAIPKSPPALVWDFSPLHPMSFQKSLRPNPSLLPHVIKCGLTENTKRPVR